MGLVLQDECYVPKNKNTAPTLHSPVAAVCRAVMPASSILEILFSYNATRRIQSISTKSTASSQRNKQLHFRCIRNFNTYFL